MRLARFTQFCIQTLPQGGPDITSVDPWQGDDAPVAGFTVTFATKSRLWLQVTGSPAPGASADDSDTPVSGPAPEHIPLPALFDEANKVSPQRAEAYLTAVLTNSDSTEIAQVYGYSHRTDQPAKNPGIGAILHNGARLYVPFVHTAQPGQDRGRNPFRLQATF
ncbi:hypothetical protein [Streptomyces sp. NPDC050485]|uniref:hypothetical protein n=1 Tax=Streptomyces sp. NPDC050485 TaxID=3365617 RepID=UPI0037928507